MTYKCTTCLLYISASTPKSLQIKSNWFCLESQLQLLNKMLLKRFLLLITYLIQIQLRSSPVRPETSFSIPSQKFKVTARIKASQAAYLIMSRNFRNQDEKTRSKLWIERKQSPSNQEEEASNTGSHGRSSLQLFLVLQRIPDCVSLPSVHYKDYIFSCSFITHLSIIT